MKNFLLSLTLVTILFAACNNNGSDKQASDSTSTMGTAATEATVNKKPASEILSAYLRLKNALTNDNDKEAAAIATELAGAFKAMDKTALTPEQRQVFTDVEADAIEHADHIAANAGNLVHQREHFETLSEEVYELVKATGAGQKLYYTHCPMYNNNKGANWLSETKEVKNPYFGLAMSTCGLVKEELN
ncbi:Protein of unknown function [Daejeonella rubra]|uniref:DUF3347 domain-containing protein n=1 Tax=Daejeonella rubra TaxID=990371 RepID=A0A1G9NL96_9SPHI|nr:DUF3347 domain-containing protein [Daejeonella rubra]SDL87368.1 Protein of unknown function [Daejeonella rubra]